MHFRREKNDWILGCSSLRLHGNSRVDRSNLQRSVHQPRVFISHGVQYTTRGDAPSWAAISPRRFVDTTAKCDSAYNSFALADNHGSGCWTLLRRITAVVRGLRWRHFRLERICRHAAGTIGCRRSSDTIPVRLFVRVRIVRDAPLRVLPGSRTRVFGFSDLHGPTKMHRNEG